MTKIRSSRSSRVRDRRGASGGSAPGGSSGGFPFGAGGGGTGGLPIKAGGGVIGLLVVLAVVLLPQLFGGGGGEGSDPFVEPAPGGDAVCESEIEQVVCGAVDDVSLYWEDQFPRSFQGEFPGTDTVLFSGSVDTGCGFASAQTGPFYCPADQLVYFDLDFLEQLQAEFSATGDLAAQYIVAHEYGHHVQNVTGISDRVRQAQQQSSDAANEFSVAQELQADCFAGAWAASVSERGLFDRPDEITEALEAAEAVGDDRILEQAGRVVDPDLFTHGTAEQRRMWFERGFETGDPERCTTFDGSLAP
jgi:hypothetical protein